MNMKDHILAALREQFEAWEALLASLSAEQIATPLAPSDWTVKDVLAHLMAWQQRSLARMEAARAGRDPVFPQWRPGLDPDGEASPDETNALLYRTYHAQPWETVYPAWREGFLHFLQAAEGVSERDLLDSSRYKWLKGYPLAYILLASYDHHQEHWEKLAAWLDEKKG